MSNPARPGMMPLAPIDTSNDERLNMTVLWRIAQGITRERAQARSLWAVKGGTALAIGYGLPRPSTDLDIDVNRPIDLVDIVRNEVANDPRIHIERLDMKQRGHGYLRFHYRHAAQERAYPLQTKIDHKLCTPGDPDHPSVTTNDTGFCDAVPVYRIERLAPMKTNTLAGETHREQARDLYDIAWLMQHHAEHITKPQRLALDRWAKNHTGEDEQRWRTLFDEDAILRRAGYDHAMLALMACLEHDAALKMMRNPQAKLTMKPVDGKMAVRINGEEYDRFDTQAHAIEHLRRLGFDRGREEAPLESPPPGPWRSRFPWHPEGFGPRTQNGREMER